MAAVLVLTMQQPMGRGSRTATLATTTPNLLPYPGTLRWQAGARDGRVGGGAVRRTPQGRDSSHLRSLSRRPRPARYVRIQAMRPYSQPSTTPPTLRAHARSMVVNTITHPSHVQHRPLFRCGDSTVLSAVPLPR